jgi:hypothetical protein
MAFQIKVSRFEITFITTQAQAMIFEFGANRKPLKPEPKKAAKKPALLQTPGETQ